MLQGHPRAGTQRAQVLGGNWDGALCQAWWVSLTVCLPTHAEAC